MLKLLSTEVGTVFYVTEQFETGTYLAANVMAVRKGDLAGGVAQTILHRVYYITKQLNPKAGQTVKELVRSELERTIGKEAIEAEIKQIRRQAAENGNDIGDVAAEQEFCARHFPSIILKGAAVEKLAEMDVPAVNALRKALRAVQEHLEDTFTPAEIRQDMPEAYRYNYLKDAEIAVEQNEDLSEYLAILGELEKLHPKAKSASEKLIYALAEKTGVLNKELRIEGFSEPISFKKNGGLKKSLSQQLKFGGSYTDFAKAIISMDTILKNAVLIDVHTDKYDGTTQEDKRLDNVSVFLSAFSDGKNIIPVQLEIKKLSGTERVLYVTVALEKIEVDVMGSPRNQSDSEEVLLPTSIYSISKLIENVNPEDKRFLKYIPDRFLSSEQREAKTSGSEIEVDDIMEKFKDQGGKREDLWGDTNALYERLTQLVRGEEVSAADDAGNGSDFDIDAYADREFTYSDAEQVRAENDGAASARNFEDMTPAEQAAEIADLQSEIDPFMTLENKNIFAVFKDGEFWEMEVTNELWEAVQALDNEKVSDNIVLTAMRWNVDKKL